MLQLRLLDPYQKPIPLGTQPDVAEGKGRAVLQAH